VLRLMKKAWFEWFQNEMLDCLVLREYGLAKHDFLAWYSSETYTDQAQSTEHRV